jgi:hypothetical protein
MAKQSKGRKVGRGKNRPSSKVYVAVKRAEINKAKRIAKHARRMNKKIDRKINGLLLTNGMVQREMAGLIRSHSTVRGTARARRRLPKQLAWAATNSVAA